MLADYRNETFKLPRTNLRMRKYVHQERGLLSNCLYHVVGHALYSVTQVHSFWLTFAQFSIMSSTSDGEKAKDEDEDKKDSEVVFKAVSSLDRAKVDLPTAKPLQASKEEVTSQTHSKFSIFLQTSR